MIITLSNFIQLLENIRGKVKLETYKMSDKFKRTTKVKQERRQRRAIDPRPWEKRILKVVNKYAEQDDFNPMFGAQILGMGIYLVNDTICQMLHDDGVKAINFSEFMPGTYAYFLTDLIEMIEDAQNEGFPLFLLGSLMEWEKYRMQSQTFELYTDFKDKLETTVEAAIHAAKNGKQH